MSQNLRSRPVVRAAAWMFAVTALASLAAGCASSGTGTAAKKDPSKGFQTLDATVISRDTEAPGSGGSRMGGEPTYYLTFEAREGEATSTFRFPVTRAQYQRYVEGSHVQLLMANHDLRDIRPAN
jgi:hypothetical protein